MTNFMRKSFSVLPGTASQERWEATFGKKNPRATHDTTFDRAGDGTVTLRGEPVAPHPKATVPISGVWLRTSEVERASWAVDPAKPDRNRPPMTKWTRFELLVEIEGKWRLIQTHETPSIDQTISHITEPAGIEQAPVDVL